MENRQIKTGNSANNTDNAREIYCPKCNSNFTCRAGDIINCQCYSVPLTDQTREFLSETSVDCLCKSCLEKEALKAVQINFPKSKKPALVENLHFYMEGQFCVFTEFYHLQRGYCCKSGCRHCPYNDESVS